MEGRARTSIDSGETARIDALYKSFPPFSRWPQGVPDEASWDKAVELFELVAADASPESLEQAREVAVRTAAFDSGAIEGLYPTDRGLTITVATQAIAWQERVEEQSTQALDLFAAQLRAFELIRDAVADRLPQLTQTWLRRLHAEIVSAQHTYDVETSVGRQKQPLPKGEYKQHPNHVRLGEDSFHAYAPVDSTQSEMQRLVGELNSGGFLAAHPVVQAAYAHYALTLIHPFADGNGRVARALSSVYLYRGASVPLIVFAEQREQYLNTLHAADEGDLDGFGLFISRAARSGVEISAEGLKTAQAPQPSAVLQSFDELYQAQGGLSHQGLDEVANEFADHLRELADREIEQLEIPNGVSLNLIASQGGNFVGAPDGFRQIVDPGGRNLTIDLRSAPPADASLQVHFDVFASRGEDIGTSVIVLGSADSDSLSLGLADLRPTLSGAARLRVVQFIGRQLGVTLSQLLREANRRLGRAGY